MRRLARSAALLGAAALAGCGSAVAGAPLHLPPSTASLPRSRASHVVLLVLENREYAEAMAGGSSYVVGLARRGALFTDYHAITHPSLPNYIALLAGNPLGIASDCTDCSARGATLVDQLEAAHRSWRAYMEGLPHPCFRGAEAGGYAKKHDLASTRQRNTASSVSAGV
jgi:predicted small lipoprotein YifL